MVVYGAVGAGVGAALLAALCRRRKRLERALPWGLTLALVSATGLSWWIPARLAFHLPQGINERLLKAAIWLTLTSVIAFLTALLHGMERRRYGWRSRLALALLAVLSVLVLAERRASFAPRPEALARGGDAEPGPLPALLVVGIETATLDAVLPLAEQGALPFFARLLEGGSHGRLQSLDPGPGEPLWTTLATGRLPYVHGVVASRTYPAPQLGPGLELRLLPDLEPFRVWAKLGSAGVAVDARVRRSSTLWEILAARGNAVAVLGWPVASPPAVPLARLETPPQGSETARSEEAGSLGPGSDRLRRARLLEIWQNEPEIRASFLLLSDLRLASRCCFGGYTGAEFDGLRRSPYLEAAQRVRDAYRAVDQELARLWEALPQPALLVVVSAHGTGSPDGWQRLRAELSEQRSLKGYFSPSPDGLLFLYGEGFRPEGRFTGARLVDVAPTLLYALGFPVARDLDGRVLREAFSEELLIERPLTFVGSYQDKGRP